MKTICVAQTLLQAAALAALSAPVFAHDTFAEVYVPAGYRQELTLQVNHGCKGSPVKEVHVKIPDGVSGVSAAFNREWKIETKMRKLQEPVPGEGGHTITETADEIVWRTPTSVLPPSGMYDSFKFRVSLPNTPGRVLWFKAYQVCEQGDDRHVEVPKQDLTADMPDFTARFRSFYRGTAGPAPYVILTKPGAPQSPLNEEKSPGK